MIILSQHASPGIDLELASYNILAFVNRILPDIALKYLIIAIKLALLDVVTHPVRCPVFWT